MKNSRINIIVAIFLGFTNLCYAQTDSLKLQYKFGAGASLSGTGDITFYEINNGLNYKLGKYFSGDLNLTYGTVIVKDLTPPASLVKTDVNILLSPFGNEKLIAFRIGGGGSYQYSPRTYVKSVTVVGGEIVDIAYEEEVINALGFNSIIEIIGTIDNKSKISIITHISYYGANVDINSGASINLYRRF